MAAVISGDTVFFFGGRFNDLHTLDMVSMEWNQVHGSYPDDVGIPSWRVCHTFTLISDTKAVLFGGTQNHYNTLGDCWILDLQKAKRPQEEPASFWTKCLHHGSPYQKEKRDGTTLNKLTMRQRHTAVLEPYSKRLWVIGGNIYFREGEGNDDDIEM